MTRAEHYCAGRAEGERWAEQDLRDHLGTGWTQILREDIEHAQGDLDRAQAIGLARGYRLTIARFERGELTWNMMG
jgi:hypothetical protein